MTSENLSSLVHELVHVASNFSEKVGQRITFQADEMQAYFVGWLAKRFLERVRRP